MKFKKLTNCLLKNLNTSLQATEEVASLPEPSLPALQNRYYVETFFLEQYFTKNNVRFHIDVETCDLSQLQFGEGIPIPEQGLFSENIPIPEQGLSVTISTKSAQPVSLQLIYFTDDLPFWMRHGLIILDGDDNILYLRAINHDPLTEWYINELANDLQDAEENFIFPGEPVQL